MKSRIGIIKDKSDLMIHLTDENIINITGMMGSGKTTLGKKISQDKNIELISLDWLFGYSIGNRPEKINKLIREIEDMYKETKNQKIFKYSYKSKLDKKIERNYYKYTSKIYKYLLQSYDKHPIIIEGRHIYKYIKFKIYKRDNNNKKNKLITFI